MKKKYNNIQIKNLINVYEYMCGRIKTRATSGDKTVRMVQKRDKVQLIFEAKRSPVFHYESK